MDRHNKILGGGGFHHVAIKVYDFEKAVAFYKALGMTEKLAWGEGDGRGVLLDTGDGSYFEVFAGAPEAEPRDEWGKGSALIHVALRTSDVDAATELAEQHGGRVTMQPKDIKIAHVPVRISFVQAPTGEVVEFFQNDPKDL
ncbi:MAG TPA: VOC family protein, partial [Tepidisphaeraceae bacterium]|nr:VOC family protein [Tepidisphaeraceae bacterium]